MWPAYPTDYFCIGILTCAWDLMCIRVLLARSYCGVWSRSDVFSQTVSSRDGCGLGKKAGDLPKSSLSLAHRLHLWPSGSTQGRLNPQSPRHQGMLFQCVLTTLNNLWFKASLARNRIFVLLCNSFCPEIVQWLLEFIQNISFHSILWHGIYRLIAHYMRRQSLVWACCFLVLVLPASFIWR